MEHDPDWSVRLTADIGKRVAWFRQRATDADGKRLTVQALADRCAELGLPLARLTITKLERGLRQAITPAEIMVLAAALDVSPVELIFPVGRQNRTEVLPGIEGRTQDAAQWFAGDLNLNREALAEGQFAVSQPDIGEESAPRLLAVHDKLVEDWQAAVDAARAEMDEDKAREWAGRMVPATVHALRLYRFFMRQRGMVLPELPPGLSAAGEDEHRAMALFLADARRRGVYSAEMDEQVGQLVEQLERPPVVAAIVTSPKGVLITRRQDATPPWGFVTGEVEPGEQPQDALVREVKEESSLEIRPGHVIGERDHPRTGRHMIYIAAKPAHGTKVITGDEAELAEVRWASVEEALDLMPDMFGPVRDYLTGQAR